MRAKPHFFAYSVPARLWDIMRQAGSELLSPEVEVWRIWGG